ncbi:archaea-specific SMC-related protein [Halalkalicoccus jeotgali]|uniref:Kinetochore-Ndc80 complex, subunit Spc25 n=1 Tax=Halalkalicoccus jeotgali (strain DSM 18796 / CECT 7217 / JCM 14584 / KCTC 4019 / B3) TaxID=795797 RepID=L9VV92_HALJB|nr:archaea-specific SMC-related protein [Halalkalicoccus jeotgali]ELY40912.1 Kinetochore-Ndc80 complex, subunit Spc25 [Halalkalicoccus jeotgali B3]
MPSLQNTPAAVDVEHIGGINSTSVEFTPGVTVLAGRNATNRTSFLQALMAALGSDRASLKGDADQGRVSLALDDETYTRELTRTDTGVAFAGDPYLEEAQLADLFAFLLESNPARRAVVRNEDLRELILRPVDVEEIEARISQLQAEKRGIDTQLSELSDASRERDSLEEEHARVTNQLETTEAELEEARNSLETAQQSTSDSESTGSDQLDSLRNAQSQLEDVTYDLETEQESVASLEAEQSELEAEQSELEAELEELSVIDEDEVDDLASQIEQIRGRKRELDEIISQLQTVIQFNEQITEEGVTDLLGGEEPSGTEADGGVIQFNEQITEEGVTDLLGGEEPSGTEADGGAITDQLLADQSDDVTCWTCGSQVGTEQIESTVSRLQDLRQEKVERRNELTRELEELTAQRKEYTSTRDERAELERALETAVAELTDRTDRISELEARREELVEKIEDLESAVEADEDDEDLLAAQKEVTQLELKRDRLERKQNALAEDIENLEEQLAERDQLEARREEINAELEELRTRIERIEREAIEAFNKHMETVVDLLDYGNLARIWLEYRNPKTSGNATFELHVTRQTDDDTTYEDSVGHLSESEREVTGLVLALAGYLVHNVHEEMPFILLDSLEAIDSERIAQLVEYLKEYASYIVVALLSEDANALDDDYQRVAEI